MGIKWSDIKIGTSPLTANIYIGKMKQNGPYQEWTDKSSDKTEMCVKAVMEHMLQKAEDSNKPVFQYEIPGVLKLTLEDLREKKEDGGK